MDKYEYTIKTDQIKKLYSRKDYAAAAEIADTIDWRKVRDNAMITRVADVYEGNKEYEKAKEVLIIAYERSPLGRQLAYRLTILSLRTKNFIEAEEFYEDFVEMSPMDVAQYILKYRIARAKGADIKTQIEILEAYVNVEKDERWQYELAKLYQEAGEKEKCIAMCEDILLWFYDGKYANKAAELKRLYHPEGASPVPTVKHTEDSQELKDILRALDMQEYAASKIKEVTEKTTESVTQKNTENAAKKATENAANQMIEAQSDLNDEASRTTKAIVKPEPTSGVVPGTETEAEEAAFDISQDLFVAKWKESQKQKIEAQKKQARQRILKEKAKLELKAVKSNEEKLSETTSNEEKLSETTSNEEKLSETTSNERKSNETKVNETKSNIVKSNTVGANFAETEMVRANVTDMTSMEASAGQTVSVEGGNDLIQNPTMADAQDQAMVAAMEAIRAAELAAQAAAKAAEQARKLAIEARRKAQEAEQRAVQGTEQEGFDTAFLSGETADIYQSLSGTSEDTGNVEHEDASERDVIEIFEFDEKKDGKCNNIGEELSKTAELDIEEIQFRLDESETDGFDSEHLQETLRNSLQILMEDEQNQVPATAPSFDELTGDWQSDTKEYVSDARLLEKTKPISRDEIQHALVAGGIFTPSSVEAKGEFWREAETELSEEAAEKVVQKASETATEPVEQMTEEQPERTEEVQPWETSDELLWETREEHPEETTENASEKAMKEELEYTIEETSEEITEEVTEEIIQEAPEETTEEATVETLGEALEGTSEEALEGTPGEVPIDTSEEASGKATEEVPEETIEETIEETPNEAAEEQPQDESFGKVEEKQTLETGEDLFDIDPPSEEVIAELMRKILDDSPEYVRRQLLERSSVKYTAQEGGNGNRTAEKIVPEEIVPEKTVPEEIVPKETVSKETVSKETALEQALFENTNHAAGVFDQTKSGELQEENRTDLRLLYQKKLPEPYCNMFGDFTSVEGMETKIAEALKNLVFYAVGDGTSSKNNVIITGRNHVGKTSLGLSMIKATNRARNRNGRRVAKVKASALNKRGVANAMAQILGTDLIIEQAGSLAPNTAVDLMAAMSNYTEEMLIIMEDDKQSIDRLLNQVPKLAEYFNNRLDILEFELRDLARVAQAYALRENYEIDEMGMLALYAKLDEIIGKNQGMTFEEVEEVVEDAIEHAQRITLGKLFGKFKRNKTGHDVLSEEDFL